MDTCIKIIIVGDSGVGKSSLLYSYINNSRWLYPVNTIGLDVVSKTINHNNKPVKLLFWDTAGQEKFFSMIKSYYRKTQIVFLVFAIDDLESFHNLNKWKDFINKYTNEKLYIVLIGNKADCESKRNITYDEAKSYADKNNMSYYELSHNNPSKIKESVYSIISNYLIFTEENEFLGTPPENISKLFNPVNISNKLCCI